MPDSPDTAATALPPIELDTPRLALRVWRDEHLAPFAAMNLDAEVMRYFPATQTVAQSEASLRAWQQQFATQGWSNWAVELRATGTFIGFIGLTVPRRVLPFSPCVEIGWRLARGAWGQGYATEGARACLHTAFERLGLDEVVSFTAALNTPSQAVMRRLGLLPAQADFDHPALPEGHPLRPHVLYRITRAQWQAQAVPRNR